MKGVVQEDTKHMYDLLAHVELCRHVERQLDAIGTAYRNLLSCHAATVLQSFGSQNTSLLLDIDIAARANETLHKGCWKSRGRRACQYTKQHEDDLITMVTTALDSDTYRDVIFTRAAANQLDESCLDKRKIEAIKKKRVDSAQNLYRTHICRAVWKNALGCCELTALEVLLLDGPSLIELHVNARQAIPLLERATECVAALDRNQVCRTCGGKPKKRGWVFTESCDACGRVYFCSSFCKEQAKDEEAVFSHVKECDLLLMRIRV